MTVTRETTASRQQVWDVLADGWTYSQWVVGNSRMRAVDAHWPQPGAKLQHSVGVWPLVLDDESVVEECVPLRKLVVRAKGRPFGQACIVMELTDIPGGGCRITMSEVPLATLGRLLPDRVALLAFRPRNRESTWRLAAMAERQVCSDR